jgi:cytoskeleton protein RodZ
MSDRGYESDAVAIDATKSSVQACSLLRDAREAQGLHIAALAVALKVPVKKLESLEAGRFEELPDMVFVRSLALSVCRALRIDPSSVMASLPEPHANPFKVSEVGLNTTFNDSTRASQLGLRAQISSPIGLAVLFLIVVIAVILAWPKSPQLENGSSLSRVLSDAEKPVTATEVQNVQSSLLLESAPSIANVGVAPPAIAQSGLQAAVDNPIISPQKDAETQQQSILELRAHGETWVDVTDATGQPRLRKLMHGGEEVFVTGQLPLSVTIGRVDMATVSVRGKPLDLALLARDNVARFEVK